MNAASGEFKRLEKVCRDPDCVGNPETGQPSRSPEDFYQGRLVCKFCPRRAKARRDEDPEWTREGDRRRKARQKSFRDLRDSIVLRMARANPSLFHAYLWEEIKDDLGDGESIEDWIARLIPPDPDGTPRDDARENYRRKYGGRPSVTGTSGRTTTTQIGRLNSRGGARAPLSARSTTWRAWAW